MLTSCGPSDKPSDKPSEASPLVSLSFQSTLQAGTRDINGKYLYGTEIMRLVPYKGKLYASASMWMESGRERFGEQGAKTNRECRILVLDSPEGQWKVEHIFTRQNDEKVVTLRTVTFTTDSEGNSISPVTMLLAAPLAENSYGSLDIYSLDDGTGEWVPMTLGEGAGQTRAIGFHHDEVMGIDYVFAGTTAMGTVRGAYDPAVPGRIRWEESSEFDTPSGERVMGFTDCNGVLYCATSRYIFKRTDGVSPSWQEVYFFSEYSDLLEASGETVRIGIRGLSAVPNPSGSGEVLIFSAKNKVRRLDPSAGFEETIELDMPAFLSDFFGLRKDSIQTVLAAYNLFVPYTIPQTGENVWLFGIQIKYSPSVLSKLPSELRRAVYSNYLLGIKTPSSYAAEARYFVRHADGEDISYEVGEIVDASEPTLIATRTIAVSPFPGDKGEVLYFGGFDCNFLPAHNTAWIYRGELD